MTSNSRSPLRIIARADLASASIHYVSQRLRRAHQILKSPLDELSLALVNDRTMSALHERFMHLPGPTDVLTFPLEFDTRGRVTAGEVVVCVPEARRRAKEHGVP